MNIIKTLATGCVLTGLLISSCSTVKRMNKTEKGAVIGTTGGAVAGGVIGKAAGNNPALGAVIGAVVGGVAGGVIGNRMDKQAKEIEQQVPGAQVERVGEGIVVNFEEKILFQTGRSDLSPNAYGSLDKLVQILSNYADTDVKIFGHTDNVGSESFNQSLSEKRAESVASYLTSRGLTRNRIRTQGFGESYPKCDSSTADGKACNRRVEFAITANEQMKRSAQSNGQ